jgi:hypothetical protein
MAVGRRAWKSYRGVSRLDELDELEMRLTIAWTRQECIDRDEEGGATCVE